MEEKSLEKNQNNYYNIGLDIGTSSVGWCVTDEENNIIKYKNKHLWGSRIFDEAQTKASTRLLRGVRRREQRRKERILILQELIGDEVKKVDSNFFQRLDSTKLTAEDKVNLGCFKSDENILENESEYYKKYPTIYHLRNDLVKNTEKFDIRLVYLSIHHIIKYRGNFLYEGELNSINDAKIDEKIKDLIEFISQKNENITKNTIDETVQEIIEISKDKSLAKADKKDKMMELFDYDSNNKKIIKSFIQAILGYKFDLNSIFMYQDKEQKIAFSEEITNEDEIITLLGDSLDYYEELKAIYDYWEVLDEILSGAKCISEAFIHKYENYKSDLKLLKNTYKKYLTNKDYNNMLRKYYDKDAKENKNNQYINNYVAYNGKNNLETNAKCKQEDFYKLLLNELKRIPEDCNERKIIEQKIANKDFLIKLNTVSNSAIPYQLNKNELEIILNNQGKYYECISENKDKILSLLTFRIPYYIGPLKQENDEAKFGWLVRNSNEKIRPWNFERIVNEDKTAEKFILRMTNKCTYLPTEDVIPKESLLYSKFTVLQELNNIRINNRKLSKDAKIDLIENIFKKDSKITKKKVVEYYLKNGFEKCEIDGLQDGENFMSNMKSYVDLTRILGREIVENNDEDCETIIYYITIFEDNKILKRKIEREFKEKFDLTKEQINKLSKLRYKGWSRLSRKLLVGIKSKDNHESIMKKLLNNNENFMQIINNDQYGFNKIIEEALPKVNGKIKYEDIEEIPTSPANKRAIWQAIKVVQEITKLMNNNPKNIYIEFARNEDEKQMKDTRVDSLKKKYSAIESQTNLFSAEDLKRLKGLDSKYTLTEKEFLYYLQGGKCLYSGEKLNFDEISKYEVDHIIPQHFIKDDSIDNKALVKKIENQRKSGSILIKPDIINARINWWTELKENGLMSAKKFNALTRRNDILEEEATNRFVNRQLVETRQITKYVSNLLNNYYKDTTVYALRAELTHGFREKYSIYKNRNVNNFHHAKDAYIISAIGNTLDNNWYLRDLLKYNNKEAVKHWIKFELKRKADDANTKERKIYNENMILDLVDKYMNKEKTLKQINYNDCYISKMLEEKSGAYWNQTIVSPKKSPVISLKNNLPSNKYGGYTNENKAYCVIFRYTDSKSKKHIKLMGISIKDAQDIKSKKNTVENVILHNLNEINISNLKVLKNKILMNQEYIDNGKDIIMKLCSDKEIKTTKELILSKEQEKIIYLMNTNASKLSEPNRKEKEQINSEVYSKLFTELLDKLKNEYPIFDSTYKKLTNKIEKFEELGEQEQISTINGVIDLMEKSQGNLTKIGLGDREGRISGKNISDEFLKNMTFVNKSVTGIYERRYKVTWDGEQLL